MSISEAMNGEPIYSENTRKLRGLFGTETSRAINAGQRGGGMIEYDDKPTDLPVYQAAIEEVYGLDEPLNKARLDKLLEDVDNDSKLKLHFPAGGKCCVAVLPCNANGNNYSEEEIAERRFVRPVIVDENGLSRPGLGVSAEKGYHFKIFPVEKQELCSFTIGKYDFDKPKEIFVVTPDDRKRIKKQLEDAYKQAQLLFNQKK
jgi:hypothetical protein